MAIFPSPTSKFHSTTYPTLSPTRPELSAKGKNVIITGGGTGIGAETARYFAQAGASRIAIIGRRHQPLLDTKASIESKFPGTEVLAESADITKKAEVDAAFAKFAGDDKLHVLVNNAAVAGPIESARDVDPDKFSDAIHTNIHGSLLVAQAFLRHATSDAVVINVSSTAAHADFAPVFASYSVAKLAIVRLWNFLAYTSPNLSVFHVQPGVVDTDMNREAGGVEAIGYEDNVSLPASFHVWLASPEARFLKGKFLYSNWDVDELKARYKEYEGTKQLSIDIVGWPFEDRNWKFQITNAESRWNGDESGDV